MNSNDCAATSHVTNAETENGLVMGRKRAQSVTSVSSVETVVVKAKRAASSLWMLLHSQNCSVIPCPHNGCHEAKLLHLHIKTCAAGAGFDCPTNYPGCDKARKLLAHYHRCRTTRARQVGQLPSRRDAGQQQCLVCSLVARQARTMLERSSVVRPPVVASSSKTASKKSNSPSSYSVDIPTSVIGDPLDSENSSEEFMPPPPPRAGVVTAHDHAAVLALKSMSSASSLKLRQQLPVALSEPSLVCLSREELGGSFDKAERQYKQQSIFARGRDRSLSINKDTRNTKKVSIATYSSGLYPRRRSASVGCVPSLKAALCGTIDEEEALMERLDFPEEE